MDKRQLKKYITFYALERLYKDMYAKDYTDLESVYGVDFDKENKYVFLKSERRKDIGVKQEGVNLMFEIFDIDPTTYWKNRRFDRPALSRSQVIRFTDVLVEMIENAEKKIDLD